MTTVSSIAVPRWVAGLNFDQGATCPGGLALRRIGPFDVLDDSEGLEWSGSEPASRAPTVLLDGYLFDRAELCSELRLPASATEAAIVAAGYRAWGRDVFQHLPGCYLTAIWDDDARRLLVGHDPLGRHPVFYTVAQRCLWFGSNALALAAHPHVSNRPNRISLAFAAMTLWPEAGETHFADIKRLRPGWALEVDDTGTVLLRKYWDPLPRDASEWLTEREVLTRFEPALIRAVERCMQFEPHGIMLSGGVDSVTIAALASRHRTAHGQPPLTAFSGRSDGPPAQEDQMQSRAAEALGMPHVVVRTSEWTHNRGDIELSLAATPQLPGPSRIYWVGTYMAFYRTAVANGLRVLLTGSGGDNWLSVAETHAADLLREGRFRELARFISVAAGTGGASYPAALQKMLWVGGIKPLVDSFTAKLLPATKARFHRRRAEMIAPAWLCPDPAFRREFIDRLMLRRTPALDEDGRLPRNYYQHAVAGVGNPHLHHEFETAFHVDALCGLRLLSPYHDPDVVQFFTRIPPRVLVHGNKYKGLLRPVVEKYLPGRGFEQQRKDYPKEGRALDLQSLRGGVRQAWPRQQFATLESLDLVDSSISATEQALIPTHGLTGLVRMFAVMSAEIWASVHAR